MTYILACNVDSLAGTSWFLPIAKLGGISEFPGSWKYETSILFHTFMFDAG